MSETTQSFRCPKELQDCLKALQEAMNITQSALIARALRQMNAEVMRRNGRLVPAYKGKINILPAAKASSPERLWR